MRISDKLVAQLKVQGALLGLVMVTVMIIAVQHI